MIVGGLLAFIVSLSVIIIVHELGHYLAARWMGVHVEIFSLGYGKRLWGKKIAGTDFRISAFPMGGFAKMYGDITEEVAAEMVSVKSKKNNDEEEPEENLEPKEDIPIEKSFFSKNRWQRFVILVAGSVFNIIFAILIIWFTNLAGRDIPAYKYEAPVLAGTVADSPSNLAGMQKGDKILTIDGEIMEKWEDVEIKIILNPKKTLNIIADRNGENVEFNIKPVMVTENRIGFIGLIKPVKLQVGGITKDSPAERMGMKVGDIITRIDDLEIDYWYQGVETISKSPNKMLTLIVERDNNLISLTGTTELRKDEETGEVIKDKKTGKPFGVLGFSYVTPSTVKKYGFYEGFVASVKENVRFAGLFVVSIGKLVSGQLPLRSMSGIFDTAKISIDVAQQGALPFIFLMGFISLNLGLFNLAPIPLLDGGAIFILFLEGLRRKDFSLEVKERILQIGFFIIVALVIIIFYNDIAKLI